MKRWLKITLWVGVPALVGGTYFTVRAYRKSRIREALDKAFNDPTNPNAVSGLDKLLVQQVFDKRLYARSGKATLSLVEARERAREVWENYTYFGDSDTDAMIEAFDNLGHLHDVSKIAHEFYGLYSEELLTVLNNAMGDISAKNSLLVGKLEKLPKQ